MYFSLNIARCLFKKLIEQDLYSTYSKDQIIPEQTELSSIEFSSFDVATATSLSEKLYSESILYDPEKYLILHKLNFSFSKENWLVTIHRHSDGADLIPKLRSLVCRVP